MKTLNQKTAPRNLQASLLGLSLAAAAMLAKPASAHDHRETRAYGPEVHGQVEIVREVPGGAVHVGVEVGRPRPTVIVQQPTVVVERRPVVVEDRRVVVVRPQPAREVTVIKEKHRTIILKRDACGRIVERVVVQKRHGRGNGCGNGHGNGHGRGHGRDWDRDEDGYARGSYDSYEDASGRIYEARADEHGTYRYYEDDNRISIAEVRDGQSRNVYVRK